jgi:hypothetical protein
LKLANVVIVGLLLIVLIETSFIAYPAIVSFGSKPTFHRVGSPETYSFGYALFNRPVTNNTDNSFRSSYNDSWVLVVRSSLVAASADGNTEAQMAFAPSYPVEGESIPTLILQERADGLLRLEYFAQSWPNTYGLVLYNSTSLGWAQDINITLRFVSLGPPSMINPQVAPRPNGNLTVLIGSVVVVSNFPIAWASLDEVYIYGLRGSSFTNGAVDITVQRIVTS